MLLRPIFPNGPFGDPALYVWQINEKRALLFDCGDLTRFTTRQLLKVTHIFLSHCHIDHFFGFDLFLRVHVGSEKSVTIFGPPDTSKRVGGKLQGYTWNLVHDQNLEFIAVDLDAPHGRQTFTRFHARDRFKASTPEEREWDARAPVLDVGTYNVRAAMLDHRTPSMAYAVEEKITVGVNPVVLREIGREPGDWIGTLKEKYVRGGLTAEERMLAAKLLIPRQRHKIVYATDGAACERNRRVLMDLARGADLFFCETCFLQVDEDLAHETKHFTAKFVARLARDAGVKKLEPFHFSKRYLDCPQKILDEINQQL